MGTSVVRNLIGILALIILSFLIGITTADNAKSAVIIIIAIAGIIGVIAMGKNVWMALFLLVPFGQALPLYSKIPAYFVYVIPVFVYWCILAVLGHVRFTWRKLAGADFCFFLFLAYMMTSIYRFPAIDVKTCSFLGINPVYVCTNLEYYLCVFVLVFYVSFSCIPFEKKYLFSVIKWGVIVKLVLLFVAACMGMNDAMEGASISDTLVHSSRLGMFSSFGFHLFVFTYASAPFQKLLQSPKAIAAILFSICLILISGFRNRLGRLGLTFIGVAVIKKEYLGFIAAACLGVCMLSLINSRDTLSQLPRTAQRVLSIIPWMDVNPSVRKGGESSTNWRIVMWQWALDPRTGHIKNYVWGDGCVLRSAQVPRDMRALARKRVNQGEQEFEARVRSWHSGFISVLQELGIVGLGIVILSNLYALITTIRIGSALRKSAHLKYFLVYTYSFLQTYVTFYILPASTHYFLQQLALFSYLKLYHWIAVEEGLLSVGRCNRRYIPVMIQQESGNSTNQHMPISL